MGGTQWSTELTSTQTTASDWGIRLEEYLNPLAPGESYTVRLYLLQPSVLWSRELECFDALASPSEVDTTNSAPLRILFTVPYISPALRTRLDGIYPKPEDTTNNS